jgi:hypothetical protein
MDMSLTSDKVFELLAEDKFRRENNTGIIIDPKSLDARQFLRPHLDMVCLSSQENAAYNPRLDKISIQRYDAAAEQLRHYIMGVTEQNRQKLAPYLKYLHVAGGSIISILTNKSINDIDIFLVGHDLTTDLATEILVKLHSVLSERYQQSYRTRASVTYLSDPDTDIPTIQIITRIYKNVSQLLYGFDLQCAAIAVDLTGKWAMTKLCRVAFDLGMNIVDSDRMSASFAHRLQKYLQRGFTMVFPFLSVYGTLEDYAKLRIYNDDDDDDVIHYSNVAQVRLKYMTLRLMDQQVNGTYTGFIQPYNKFNTSFQPKIWNYELYLSNKNYHMHGQERKRNPGEILETAEEMIKKENQFLIENNDNLQWYKVWLGPEKLPDVTELVQIVNRGSPVREYKSQKLQFITDQPDRQWTSSFNPMDVTPADFYGARYAPTQETPSRALQPRSRDNLRIIVTALTTLNLEYGFTQSEMENILKFYDRNGLTSSVVTNLVNKLKRHNKLTSSFQKVLHGLKDVLDTNTFKGIKGRIQKLEDIKSVALEKGFDVRELATQFDVPKELLKNATEDELWALIVGRLENLLEPKQCDNLDEMTVLGDSISDLPEYLKYSYDLKGKKYCYNILELYQELMDNHQSDHYKRIPFRNINSHHNRHNAQFQNEIIDDIRAKGALLTHVLSRRGKTLDDNPLLTIKQSMPKNKFRDEISAILSKMRYPAYDAEQFMKLNPRQIRNLSIDLRELGISRTDDIVKLVADIKKLFARREEDIPFVEQILIDFAALGLGHEERQRPQEN